MMIKAAIFDVDGTLINTEAAHWDAWREVLKYYNIVPGDEYDLYAGRSATDIENIVKDQYGIKVRRGELVRKKRQLVLEWFKSRELHLMPYARETVYRIQKKMPVAVASGSVKEELHLKLKKTNLFDRFSAIVSADDVVISKPHPEIYITAAKQLKVSPRHSIAFEDTQIGVQSAKAAGMVCVAIPNEFTQRQDFSKADKIFPHLRAAYEWMESVK